MINLYMRVQCCIFVVRKIKPMIQDIRIDSYDYPLPEDRIARYPLAQRDDSKLLVYTESSGRVPENRKFRDLADYLPENSMVVFNETKVVPTRLFFRKETGATIEIFCLEPDSPADYQQCFATTETCVWQAIIGNAKRWKDGALRLCFDENHPESQLLAEMDLRAELLERGDTSRVAFSWKGGYAFSQVLGLAGRVPIPPYLKREAEPVDRERYQTWYARREGSVAAPTAGLHFTDRELDALDKKGITRCHLCLHVGAGTFLPVKSETIGGHVMHSEPFSVSRAFLKLLAGKGQRPLTAVGTTSARCLESLYYLGVHCIEQGEPGVVEQWEPYRDRGYDYSLSEAVEALVSYMDRLDIQELVSRTRIIIVPGFRFRTVDFLVTNFHQPKSTLLLLISAFIGDAWRGVYDFALENGFRFLSYGDSSLLQKV